MHCLVTGADGFLGAHLCRALLEAGHVVVGAVLNRSDIGGSLDALDVYEVRMEYGDITDREYVDRIVNAAEPDVVYHLAAVSIVRIADANPARALRTNVLGTLNVVDVCQRENVRCIVASSDKAYGDYDGTAYTEDLALRPAAAYEVSKACADHIARLYGAIVTRCANLYGPADLNWSRLVPNSCRLALTGQAPVVTEGAWEHLREWLYVADAVDAYLLLARRGERGQAYNVGSGQHATPGAVAESIASFADAPAPVGADTKRQHEIPRQRLDCSKMAALGWQADTLLIEGLERTVDWYRSHLCGC